MDTATNDTLMKRLCDLKMKYMALVAKHLRLQASPEGLALHARYLLLLANLAELEIRAHEYSHTLDETDPNYGDKMELFLATLKANLNPRMMEFIADEDAFYGGIDQQLKNAKHAIEMMEMLLSDTDMTEEWRKLLEELVGLPFNNEEDGEDWRAEEDGE